MNKFYNTKNLELFIFGLFWIFFWLSINTMPFEIYFFGENLIKSINSLRLLIALLISAFLFIYVAYKLSFKEIIYNFKKHRLIILFLLLFLTHLISLIFNQNRNLSLDNTYLIILSIGTISLYFLIYNYDLKKNLENFIIINIFFLLLICLVIIIPKFQSLTFNNYDFYQVFSPKDGNILNQVNPRITGLSRSLAILTLFIFAIFIHTKKIFLKLLFFLLFLFLNFIILMMQSRGTILCFYASIFFILIFMSKLNIYFKTFFIIFIIISNFLFLNLSTESKINNEEINYQTRLLQKNTSGRLDIWEYSVKNYNFKNLLGYGPQGDRIFLNDFENKKSFGDNSSNAFLYTLLSGGYFGLIFIIFIYFIIVKNLKSLIFHYKNESVYLYFSISVIIFLIVRSIFENSFSLFSIDYLLIFSSILYIQASKNKKLN